MSRDDLAPRFQLGRGFVPKLALSLLIAFAFWLLLRQGALELMPRREALLRVEAWSIAIYFVLFAAMHFLRSARWYLLLAPIQPVRLGTVVRVALIGYLAIALLPFRMGEAARPLLIRRDAKVSAWAATGTVGAERLIDGLSISLLLLAALRIAKPLDPLPDRIGELPIPVSIVPGAAVAMASFFAVGCVVMAIFYSRRAWAERVTMALFALVSRRFGRWLASRIAETASGLGFLTRARYTLPFLAATLAYWLLNAASWWVLAQGCGLTSIGYFHAVATMGVVALGILVPSTPGFFGAFQLSIYAGLAMYLPDVSTTGPVYAFVGYVLPMGLTVLAGGLAILIPAGGVAETGHTPEAERASGGTSGE